MGNLKNCISSVKLNHYSKQMLTKTLTTALDANQATQRKALVDMLQEVTVQRDALAKAINYELKTPGAQKITAPEEGVDTTLVASPTFNLIKAHMIPKPIKKLLKNAMQHYYDFNATLQNLGGKISAKEFAQAHIGDTSDLTLAALDDFILFNNGFTKETQSIFQALRPKKTKKESRDWEGFRQKNPLNYLLDENDNLLPIVLSAISAGTYDWLSTKAEGIVFLEDRAIAKSLGLPADSYIHPITRKYLATSGIREKTLALELGKNIYDLLGIEPNGQGQDILEFKIQESLGLMAIGVLESKGILNKTSIARGITKKTVTEKGNASNILVDGVEVEITDQKDMYGLAWLKDLSVNGAEEATKKNRVITLDSPSEHFKIEINKKGTQETKLVKTSIPHYTLNTTYDAETQKYSIDSKLQKTIDANAAAPQMLPLLFKGERSKLEYSFEKFEHDGTLRILQDTVHPVTKTQNNNMDNYEDLEQMVVPTLLNVLHLFPEHLRNKSLGVVQEDAVHATETFGNRGRNRNIIKGWTSLQNWITQTDLLPNGLASGFYNSSTFVGNGRAFMVGSINRQNDLLHRALFHIAGTETNISLSGSKKTKNYKFFMMGLGLGLGKEYSKLGSVDAVVAATTELLESEEMAPAIKILRQLSSSQKGNLSLADPAKFAKLGEQMDEALFEELIVGMEAGEEHAASLHSMIEYAEYLNAVEDAKNTPAQDRKPFVSRLSLEVDGMGNGVFIGRTQFYDIEGLEFPDQSEQKLLTSIRNGGGIFSKEAPPIEQLLAEDKRYHDVYQATGLMFANFLSEARSKIANRRNAGGDLARFDAMDKLIGSMSDPDGAIGKLTRNFNKEPTLQTVYGAGKKSIINGMVYTEVIAKGIHGKLTDISHMTDTYQATQELVELNNIVFTLTGETLVENIAAALKNPATLRQVEISPSMTDKLVYYVTKQHGKALYDAIKAVYDPFMNARNNVNQISNISVAMYNQTLSVYLSIAESKKPEGVPLTKDEYEAVLKQVEKAIPTLKTIFGGKMDIATRTSMRDFDPKSETNFVSVSFSSNSNGKVSRKTQTVARKSGLDLPGVRGPIMGIHHIDAFVANMLSGSLKILNVYDGFFGAQNKISGISRKANAMIMRALERYSLPENIHNGSTSAINASFALLKKQGLTETDITEVLRAAYRDNDKFLNMTEYIVQQYLETDQALIETNLELEATITDPVALTKAMKKAMITRFKELEPDLPMLIFRWQMYKADVSVKNSKATQKTLMKGMIAANQYNMAKGEFWDKNKTESDEIFGIEPAHIDATSLNAVKDIADEIAENNGFDDSEHAIAALMEEETIKEEMFGSQNIADTDLSRDADAYEMAEKVDKMTIMDLYNRIKHSGPADTRDSATHDTHLQRIISTIFEQVLRPIQIYHTEQRDDIPTQGMYLHTQGDAVNDRIYISSQAASKSAEDMLVNNVRLSTGEVLVHELLHPVVRHALDTDATTRDRAQILFDIVKEKLGDEGYKIFLNDPNIDITDPGYAADIKAAKAHYNHIFNNRDHTIITQVNEITGKKQKYRKSNHLTEFISFGLANENFHKALQDIILTKKETNKKRKSSWLTGLLGENVQTAILNLLDRIVSLIGTRFSKVSNNVTVAYELEMLTRQMSGVDKKAKSMVYASLDAKNRQLTRVATVLNKKLISATKFWVSKFPKVDAAHKLSVLVDEFSDSDNQLGRAIRRLGNIYYNHDFDFARIVVDEVRGRQRRFDTIIKALIARETRSDGQQEIIIKSQKEFYAGLFDRPLEVKEKIAVLKVLLKGDVISLRDTMEIPDIAKILADETLLQEAIDNTLKDLEKEEGGQGYKYHYINQAAENLGFNMVTGMSRKTTQLYYNAHSIVKYMHDKITPRNATYFTKTALVDKLATLYALSHMPKDRKATISKLMNNYKDGIDTILLHHHRIKQESLHGEFYSNPTLMQKGYVKSIINSNDTMTTGTLADEEDNRLLSMSRAIQPLSVDDADVRSPEETIYLYTGKGMGSGNNLVHGAISTHRHAAKGTSLRDLYPPTSSENMQRVHEIMHKKFESFKGMGTPNHASLDPTNMTTLLPQYDRMGNLVTYRYVITEQTKDNLMQQYNEYDTVMAAMSAESLSKQETPKLNRNTIKELHIMWEKDKAELYPQYVAVSAQSPDEEIRNYYYTLPEGAKHDVYELFGSNTLMVHKHVLNTVFGYKKYDILDAYKKKLHPMKSMALPEKIITTIVDKLTRGRGAQVLHGAQQITMDVTSMAKSNTVVRNGKVTAGNAMSNLLQLMGEGVYSSDIISYTNEALKYGIRYQSDALLLAKAELQLYSDRRLPVSDARKKIMLATQQKIHALKDSMFRNPLRNFIESGGIPTMMDDVDTSSTASTLYPGKVEKTLDALHASIDKRSAKLGTLTKNMFLTQDTEGFRIMNNAVKMTDFVARYVLYKHYTDGKRGKPVMSHQEAMAEVIAQFINFSIPTHKMIELANNLGAAWYTKYQLRVFRTMLNTIKHNPSGAIASYALAQLFGLSHIFRSIPGVTKGMFAIFGDPFSIGLESVGGISTISLADSVYEAVT